MMDYREILRLRSLGFSQRQLEREKIVGREKSKEIYQAADRVGIHWPLDDDVTNEMIQEVLFPGKYAYSLGKKFKYLGPPKSDLRLPNINATV